MPFAKNYGFYNISKKNPYEDKKTYIRTASSFGKKLDLLCLNYVAKKKHGGAWKAKKYALAIFASIFTLGLINLSYKFRNLWEEASSGHKIHTVFIRVIRDQKTQSK